MCFRVIRDMFKGFLWCFRAMLFVYFRGIISTACFRKILHVFFVVFYCVFFICI